MIEAKDNNNLIIVYYARPKSDQFPCWDDFCDDWMVDTADFYNANDCINDQGLFDSLLSAGLPRAKCEKVFELASNRNINLDVAECIWGNIDNSPSNKTTTQAFDDLNNDLSANKIPVKFVCKWIF